MEMELNRIDRICVYLEDKERFNRCLYKPPAAPRYPKPRALKRGTVKIVHFIKRIEMFSICCPNP